MPIKCPVAPLEFTFLAEAWLRERGLRDRVELVYVTPLPGAFTKPVASEHLGAMLEERKILVESDFLVERIDVERKTLVSYDEREVPFDLLVTVPLNMGADFVARSGLGDELNYVPVDKHTLQSKAFPNIFAVGDASDIPTSKAGSVAHFSVEIFVDNFLQLIARPADDRLVRRPRQLLHRVRRRQGAADRLQLRHRAAARQLPPARRRAARACSRRPDANHLGKLAFRWIYWNVLLPGRPLPLPAHMSMVGKHVDPTNEKEDTMPVTTIAGHQIHVNEEGFLTDPDEWDEDLAKALAAPDRHQPDR